MLRAPLLPVERYLALDDGAVHSAVLERDPGDGLLVPAVGVAAVLPIAQEVVIVFGAIAGRVQELLELSVRNRVFIE